MKKYRLVKTKNEVKLGDVLTAEVVLNEASLNGLVNMGVVEEFTELDFMDVIKHLGERANIKNPFIFCSTLKKLNSAAFFQVLLKEVALMLDDNYKGHIKYSKELWGVDRLTGEVVCLSTNAENIRNAPFDKIAAFRSKEDVETALEVLKPIFGDEWLTKK